MLADLDFVHTLNLFSHQRIHCNHGFQQLDGKSQVGTFKIYQLFRFHEEIDENHYVFRVQICVLKSINVIFWELFLAKNGLFRSNLLWKSSKSARKQKPSLKKHQSIISCFSSIFQRCHFSKKQRENLKSKLNTKFFDYPCKAKVFFCSIVNKLEMFSNDIS